MAEKLGAAILELSTDDRKFRRGLRSAEGMAKKSGAKMTKMLTLPLALIGAAAGRAAATFGDEMNKLVSLVGLPRDAVENELIPALLKLGPAVGILPGALARGIFPIASAGFDASQSLDVLTASAMAAAIGVGTVETAALGTMKILANYADQMQSSAEATGILVGITKAAAAGPEQIAVALTKFLPLARELGVDLRRAGGEFAFLTLAMDSGASAAVGLAAVYDKLLKPPREMIPVMAAAGLSMEKISAIASGPGGPTAALIALKNALTDVEFKTLFQDKEAFIAAVQLIRGASDDLQESIDKVANTGVRSLIDAFQEATKSPMFRFRQGMAGINAALIVLGNAVLPLVIPFVMKLTDIIVRASRAFAAFSPKVQNTILAIAGITAIAGPVLIAVSFIMRAFGGLLTVVRVVAVGTVKAVMFMARGIIGAFLRLAAFLLSVPGLIVLGLASIAIVFVGFRDTVSTIWDELWRVLKSNAIIALRNLKNAMIRGFINVANGIIAAINKARALIGAEALGLIPTEDLKPEKLLGFSEFDVSKIAEGFKKDINKIKAKVASTLRGMVDAIKGIIPEGLMDLFFPDGLEQTELDIQAILDKMGALPGALGGIGKAGADVAENFKEIGASIASSISAATTDAIVNLRSLGDFAQSISNIILSSIVSGTVGKVTGSLFGGLFGGGAAHGAETVGGKAYLVGEEGPEIFAPGRSGTIIPNDAIRGGGSREGDTFIFNAGLPAEIAAQVRNVAAEVAAGTAVATIKEAFR